MIIVPNLYILYVCFFSNIIYWQTLYSSLLIRQLRGGVHKGHMALTQKIQGNAGTGKLMIFLSITG